MLKNVRLKLLPVSEHDSPSNLWLMHNKKQGVMLLKTATELDGVNHHLYITVEDKPSLNDLFIHKEKIFSVKKIEDNYIFSHELPFVNFRVDTCHKIIASTNLLLTNEFNNSFLSLPTIPEYFLKIYSESSLDGVLLTSALVEYENDYSSIPDEEELDLTWRAYINYKLKTINNEIIIKTKKELWNKQEIILLLESYESLCLKYQANKDFFMVKKREWLEKNF